MDLKLDAIGIVASDIKKSMQFYKLLGLPFDENDDSPHVEASTTGGLRVMLDTEEVVKSIDPNWKRPKGQSIGLAFHCGDAAGVDSAYETVLEAGFKSKLEPWDAFWGQRYAQVLDPDGHSVDLFASLD